MSEIHTICGTSYIVKRDRLKIELYTDSRANPLLWFAIDLETRDLVVCGTRTKRECVWLATADAQERKAKRTK